MNPRVCTLFNLILKWIYWDDDVIRFIITGFEDRDVGEYCYVLIGITSLLLSVFVHVFPLLDSSYD